MYQKALVLNGGSEIDPQFSYERAQSTTMTLTDMEVGKHYIVVPCIVSGSYKTTLGTHISNYTGCECTFIANSRNCEDTYAEYVCYCYYLIVPTETTVTLTFNNYQCTLDLIKLD